MSKRKWLKVIGFVCCMTLCLLSNPSGDDDELKDDDIIIYVLDDESHLQTFEFEEV